MKAARRLLAPPAAKKNRAMQGNRRRDTLPELALRRAVWARGARFRVDDKALPGRPDLSHRSRRVVVFVDGCFWHKCPRHFRRPETNLQYWRPKIAQNLRRRREVIRAFNPGWTIIEVYECQLKEGLDDWADMVARAMKGEARQKHPSG